MKTEELSDIFSTLGSGEAGLSEEEAKERLAHNGSNSIPQMAHGSWIKKLLTQFTHFFALLLWVAAAISFVVAHFDPSSNMTSIGWAILFVIILNGFFGFYQEFKTEKSLEALRKILPSKATVRRGGAERVILSEEIVDGDVVILKEGDKVPADMYLISASEVWVNESSLTGESESVSADVVGSGYHKTTLYSGTFVVKGEAAGLVFATGKDSKYGTIAVLTQNVSQGIGHLQQEIAHISKIIAIISFLIAASFIVIAGFGEFNLWKAFLFALGVLVALIPEGLLPTVTLSLAFGAKRMAAKGFLVNGLSVIENLGAVTVIATDKTGTLTQNKMEVTAWDEENKGEKPSTKLIDAVLLCNRADAASGDPIEQAFFIFAAGFVDPLVHREQRPIAAEYPFDYHLKRMTTVHTAENGFFVACKGAPEVVLGMCKQLSVGDAVAPLDEQKRKELLERHDKMAALGLRVIAFAASECATLPSSRDDAEQNLLFLGFVALVDPLREDIVPAVAQCHKAGIRLLMITGDHPVTAGAIGVEAGIISSASEVTTADKLESLPRAALRRILRKNHVFARVTPEQKLLIVTMLKEMGDTVAVTGDGVNDAPALKKADVGIAMGSGTDVAKQAAAAILVDDHFATIVKAIEEGRAVYENIRRFITYMLASNIPEAVPYILFFWMGVPLALPVALVLAIDLGTDIMPGLALGAELPHKGLMNKKPHSLKEPILTPGVYLRAFGFMGLFTALLSMGLFFTYLYAHGYSGTTLEWNDPLYLQATTLAFAAIVFAQIGNGLSCRNELEPIMSIGIFSNRYYLGSVVIELAILALLIVVPILSEIFATAPFEPIYWFAVVAIAPIVFFVEEGRKILFTAFRRRSTK